MDFDIKESTTQARHVQNALAKLRRIAEEELAFSLKADKYAIHSPSDAAELIKYEMSALPHEELWLILMDTRNQVLQIARIYKGSTNSAQVRAAELFRAAIIANATAFIMVHNHPSGDPTPSPDDIALTRAIVQGGKLLDVEILDHLIIGGGRFVSLKERGVGFSQ